jgi:MOSC domain-containing protein
MRIASLYTYPVKGCRRIAHEQVAVEPWGPAGDRRWMVVDPRGVGITQRDVARLALLTVTPGPYGLSLRAPGRTDLAVRFPADGPQEHVRVFSDKPPVPTRVATTATGWLTEFLGEPARLVWLGDPTVRPIGESAGDGDRVSLADGYPLLLTNAASLDAVNAWLAEAGDEPVPMTRFRPNVVVSGAPAWAEDDWVGRRLRLGELTVRAAKPCARCVVTTVDQDSAEAGKQPLRVLGRYRNIGGGLMFGLNLIPDAPGVLRVGDEVLDLA